MKPAHFIFTLTIILATNTSGEPMTYPETPKIPTAHNYHGTEVTDHYQWLENADDPKVQAWVDAQVKLTRLQIDSLPQRKHLIARFNELWRYDDETVPKRVLKGDRIFYWAKKKTDEKWVFVTREHENAEPRIVLNPNEWPANETIAGIEPSRDGQYLAFGKAIGGDENPVYRIMETATGRILPDSLAGWKQGVNAWLPDNSGFYYSAKPLKGTVPDGEEDYWHSVYFHKLGTSAEMDRKVFGHEKVKEYWHGAAVSEDGRYEVFVRSLFYASEIYFRKTGSADSLIPLATGLDAEYNVEFVGDKILIVTDSNAPLYQVYIADAAKPQRENWRVLIPQHEKDKLSSIAPVAGHLYATYEHNAHTVVRIYDLNGQYVRDLAMPTIGSGGVSGYWSRDDVWVSFTSFAYPPTTFKYDFTANKLNVYKAFPLKIDVSNIEVEQVWYPSEDGTPVSMFLVHRKGLKKDGKNPVYLYGYGGFNISLTPYFSNSYLVWLEAGGMIAIANLRGGGEYGQAWHKAGMFEKKQNVFDDFIAAGEWLIANNYTNPQKLAIGGGSNGGLLVGAVAVQRPDLFKAVDCAVPLLDMLRYHQFEFAKVWAEEYGSADDPEQFKYIYKYSPYHNVKEGVNYPTMLITGSARDARTNPLHARKMVARMQAANPNGQPILLREQTDSGHHGGTTISVQIEQAADAWAFMMNQLGITTN